MKVNERPRQLHQDSTQINSDRRIDYRLNSKILDKMDNDERNK
jgi:hypothetical protein